MIHLILLILLNLSFIPYILVIVYPSIQPWQYILIIGILNVLNIFIYIKYLKSKNIFSDVYLLKINRYFYLKWVVTIVFISIGLNFMINRWIFDSYGLWDAWAMWNLKAKVITYSIMIIHVMLLQHITCIVSTSVVNTYVIILVHYIK